MKKDMKRLMLNRETVRALQDAELGQVAGGLVQVNGSVPTICTIISCIRCAETPTEFCPNLEPKAGEAF
jgi:hypothetical protein